MTREEAIRRIKAWKLDSDHREVLAVIIPELRESEDERIRKDIVAAVEMRGDLTQARKSEIYAYLEKQEERAAIPSRETILGIWELGNIWKDNPEERNGLTMLQYIQDNWLEKCDYIEKPETAELSDDERARKEAISIVQSYMNICDEEGDPCLSGYKVLDYLEKQKIFSENGEGVYGYKDGKICFMGKWLDNSMYMCDAPVGQDNDGNLVYAKDLKDGCSEDERIRKAMLAEYKERLELETLAYKNPECNKDTVSFLEKAVDYLERQERQKPSIFPPGFGEVRWNPIPCGKDIHDRNLAEDLEEEINVYLRNFSSSFENGIEYAKNIARHFFWRGFNARKGKHKTE